MKAGLAVNPETDVDTLRPFVDMVDAILMMRVRPGFAGQSAVSDVDERLPLLCSLFSNTPIIVDGAVTPDTVASMKRKGASGFVLGTSSLFGKNEPYRKIIHNLRTLAS